MGNGSAVEAAAMESIMHMEIVMDEAAMREKASVREESSTKPARKWIENALE